MLEPDTSRYQALFIGAGNEGWLLAEPGWYTIYLALGNDGEDFVSNPLRIKVLPPHDRQDDVLAQDVFTKEVSRVLAFDGSRVLDDANTVLREVAARLPDRPIARHARIALGRPLMRAGKVLQLPASSGRGMGSAAA